MVLKLLLTKHWDLGFPKKAVKSIKALPNYTCLLREPNIPSSEATWWLRNTKNNLLIKAHQRAGETHLHSAGPRTIWEGNKHDKICIDAMISLANSGTFVISHYSSSVSLQSSPVGEHLCSSETLRPQRPPVAVVLSPQDAILANRASYSSRTSGVM